MSPLSEPFKQAIANFKEHLTSLGRASATILAYTKDIEQLADFIQKSGKTTPSQVTPDDINDFKSSLSKEDYTAKSISRKINSIKAFFRFLETQNQVTSNPATQITHPKYEVKPPRILSKLEYRALRDACRGDARISAIVELLLQTGIRISELANLKLEDLDLTGNRITIKAYESHPERTIPLNPAAKIALENYLKERPKTSNQFVFVTKTGNPFLVRNIRSSIDRFFRLAGIDDAKVNDLRHTFIAQQLMAGTPLVYVSKLAGHKRLSTTEKYLEFISEKVSREKPKIEEL
ncbi:tyrosine-type recombinase/integrase [Candidatus Collierbacteria bacterium]|nr:tyrosine-type recombinase/integrase [Candidatus Collierbacteria bacterium]